jgi:Fur family peroxide stress response transcriptional regulator
VSKVEREIEAALRENGLRCTTQRLLLLEHLMRSDIHESADEIYASVNHKRTKISRASIYNNLHALAESGLVRQVPVEGNIARFDANVRRHHHFICDRCGAVEDIDWFEPPSPGTTGLRKHLVRCFEATLRGKCPKCR